MKDAGTHVGKLAELLVGDALNALGVFRKLGVCRENTRNVGPVFINVGIQEFGEIRARYVGAAAGEQVDVSVGICAVEAGNNDASVLIECGADASFAFDNVELAVVGEADDVSGIHEGISEVAAHQTRAEIFAAADQAVLIDILAEGLAVCFQFRFDIEINIQCFLDLLVTGNDGDPDLIVRNAVFEVASERVEQVCDLVIVGGALAGCGNDDHAASGIGFDDVLDFFELCGICKGASAEFRNDHDVKSSFMLYQFSRSEFKYRRQRGPQSARV